MGLAFAGAVPAAGVRGTSPVARCIQRNSRWPGGRKERRRTSVVAALDGGLAVDALRLVAEAEPDNTASLAVTGLTFFLTFWGIISFIKGSTKDRITQARYETSVAPETVMTQTMTHFTTRSFRVNREADKRPGVVTFEGEVRPSYIIAGLLLSCGGAALWGLGVILNLYLPENLQSAFFNYLPILSLPVVPWYWNGAARTEQFKIMMEENSQAANTRTIYVKGHREEIAEFQNALTLQPIEPE
eukprot:CAMPEP_0198323206 /NCGR_PEP_ID=MMETSP1450-20131203/11513_1 /TAXON_ID=753684 ORGANISM="Madagascaria erythrocladiodes, Strain CCMP3234" /NCGR_SAMPLE_ID=MMETSP1450 /ASSEMBLY_ACC=CAM_ASM_001115 /LENGTH=243 /DNA_ID=CAMNT_0044026887 /DNA_START=204 /DNA_END=935 /DNA_ORIENTATION=+